MNIYDVPGVLEEMEMKLYLNVHQEKEGRLKMRRLSISDKDLFVPEKGEIFFAEVPNKGIDRKVKTLVSKDRGSCEKCCFRSGELGLLCWGVRCTTIYDETQLTFRRVSDGKI